jgi:hypothetical protein
MTTTPTEKQREMTSEPFPRSDAPWILLRGIAGGIVGGVIGFFVFQWLARRGMYGMMIPGASIGLGAGLAARGRSVALGVLCLIGALCLAVFAEWKRVPFNNDPSLTFFVTHLAHLRNLPVKAIMAAVGAAFAYWLGQGRDLP